MMQQEQIGFAWDADVNLPIAGRTPLARHCSATGAHAAAESHEGKLSKLLRHFAANRRLTIHELAAKIGVHDNRVTSAWNRAKYDLGWIEETGEVKRHSWGFRVAAKTDTAHGRVKGQPYEVISEQAYHRLTAVGRQAAFDLLRIDIRRIEARRSQ